jgi:hypothetical protein
VLYGAAEFSRDADIAIHATAENLLLLESAFADLRASVVAVPQFELRYLQRGHAIHFRCERADVSGLRIDIMSVLRGVDGFDALWQRRTSLFLPGVDGADLEVDLMSLPDLVASKKTQRDKDWPMIRRLVEANYFEHRSDATGARITFWLRELRTADLLIECAALIPVTHRRIRLAPPSPLQSGETQQWWRRRLPRRRRSSVVWTANTGPLRAELESLRLQQRK